MATDEVDQLEAVVEEDRVNVAEVAEAANEALGLTEDIAGRIVLVNVSEHVLHI